jgi:hypothetical protein
LIGFLLTATFALGAFRLGVRLSKMAFFLLFPLYVRLGLALFLATLVGGVALVLLTLLTPLVALISLTLLTSLIALLARSLFLHPLLLIL